jgi:hypothetical protein
LSQLFRSVIFCFIRFLVILYRVTLSL